MSKIYKILIFSGFLLTALLIFLSIKKYKPSFMTGKEIVYLTDNDFKTVNISIDEYMTKEEYLNRKEQANMPNPISIEKKIIDGKEVEVISLGTIGILGEKLDIQYIDTETRLDEDKYTEYFADNNNLSTSANELDKKSEKDNTDKDSASDNQSGNTDNNSVSDSDADNADNSSVSDSDADNADNNSVSDSDADNADKDSATTDTDNDKATSSSNEATNNSSNKAVVKEFVKASNSAQELGYVIYAPENANANTPILLYLHGIGQNGVDYKTFVGALSFIKYLINGNWEPDVIIVAPILNAGSRWIYQTDNLKTLLGEVTNYFGGNMDNVYIAGFSAGCDSITPLAKSIKFKGALFMAGYLGAVGNTVSSTDFLALWSGKDIYYFQDSLYSGGGYGYSADYIAACKQAAGNYNVNFKTIDMNWEHRSTMVDAILLPSYFKDAHGNYCLDILSEFIK